MTTRRLTYLYCDGPRQTCPQDGVPSDVAPRPEWDAGEVRGRAAAKGWVRINGRDYCPTCAKNVKTAQRGRRK